MKVVVVEQAGQYPVMCRFCEPLAKHGEQIVTVLAAGIKPLD